MTQPTDFTVLHKTSGKNSDHTRLNPATTIQTKAHKVKATLTKADQTTEIRRFEVDDKQDYQMFRDRLAKLYGHAGEDFDLFWKDEQNDMIKFSSDEEMEEAKRHLTGGVFNVYVEAKSTRRHKALLGKMKNWITDFTGPSNGSPAPPTEFWRRRKMGNHTTKNAAINPENFGPGRHHTTVKPGHKRGFRFQGNPANGRPGRHYTTASPGHKRWLGNPGHPTNGGPGQHHTTFNTGNKRWLKLSRHPGNGGPSRHYAAVNPGHKWWLRITGLPTNGGQGHPYVTNIGNKRWLKLSKNLEKGGPYRQNAAVNTGPKKWLRFPGNLANGGPGRHYTAVYPGQFGNNRNTDNTNPSESIFAMGSRKMHQEMTRQIRRKMCNAYTSQMNHTQTTQKTSRDAPPQSCNMITSAFRNTEMSTFRNPFWTRVARRIEADMLEEDQTHHSIGQGRRRVRNVAEPEAN